MATLRFAWMACSLACACGGSDGADGDTTGADGSTSSNTASGMGSTGTGTNAAGMGPSSTVSGMGTSASTTAGGAGGLTTSGETSATSSGATSGGGSSGSDSTASNGGSAGAGAGGTDGEPGTPVEEEVTELPFARGEHGVGALDGEVYVLGGFTPTVTASVQIFNPESNSWRDAADFPVVLHHPNVAAVGGMLYVLGFHATQAQRVADGSSYAYDPVADEWTARAPQPLGTDRGASCVTVYQDKVYVFGGTNDVALPDASVYDPEDDSWEVLPPMPILRHHCLAAVVDDRIYLVEGRDVVIEEVQPECYVYDPVEQTYTEIAPILTPRGGAAGGVLGGRIYVFGGEGNQDDPNGIFKEAEVYDPATDSWASLPDMTTPRHGFGAAIIGDRMYLPGGSTAQGIQATATHTVFYLDKP